MWRPAFAYHESNSFHINTGAGGLTVQNFLFVMARRECNTKLKQSLVNAFQLFDKDGNGFIGVEELKVFFLFEARS